MKRFEQDYSIHNSPIHNSYEAPHEIEASTKGNKEEEKRQCVERVKTTMLSRNVNILGHRTSVRLEKEMWESLKNISDREGCKVHDICSLVQIRKRPDTSLTAAIRVFVMLYYKAASTEEGHHFAGHGSFENMKRRAGFSGDFKDMNKNKDIDPEFNDKHIDQIQLDENISFLKYQERKDIENIRRQRSE